VLLLQGRGSPSVRMPSKGLSGPAHPDQGNRRASGWLGKSQSLRKDSTLRTIAIDISHVDLTQLIGGKHFTISCTLAYNGYRVQTSALVDSGANGFVFIDTQCATNLARFLDVAFTPLPTPYPVRGFDGKPGRPATHAIILNLGVARRQQRRIPMLILDLGNHDLILGRKWLSYFDVWLDVRNQRLLWPNQPREHLMT
jgi:hypothetical protein